MSYKPCEFDRQEYLEMSGCFESGELVISDAEYCEFNGDPEDLSTELAYTRYALAKAEQELKEARKQRTENNIGSVCSFIEVYENRKFQIMHEGGKLLSPVDFMLDYCKDLRRKAEEL